jgi:hypothetical protein
MYEDILNALAELGAYELGEISHRTGLSRPLVEQLLDEMHAQGYIEPLGSECETGCSKCSCSGGCGGFQAPKGWAFTEKGVAILERTKRRDAR